MRRAVRLLLVPAAVLLLAGCPARPQEELVPNAVDRERVARIAKDPWAAPTTTTVPRQSYGSNGLLTREAGRRETTREGDDNRPMFAAEVDAALADGWSVVGARCEDDGQVERVELTRGETLDDTARAVIVAYPEGSATAPAWRLQVRLIVPHHADEGWPRPDAVDPGDTCLATEGAPSIEVEDVSYGEPYPATTS